MTAPEKKSTHRCDVVPVTLEPHGNADKLSIVRVYGFQVVVRTEDWIGVDKAAFVQPDSVVPEIDQFAFLWGDKIPTEKDRRIRVRKFRGEMSQGLLIPAPIGSKIGDDVSDILGITRYEPKEPKGQGANFGVVQESKGPSCFVPVYDVENWYRYGASVFTDGEPVTITEKVHGTNARFLYSSADAEFFVGSRKRWLREFVKRRIPPKSWFRRKLEKHFTWLYRYETVPSESLWWRLVDQYPGIKQFCVNHPNCVLYGEMYGCVQDLKYGHTDGAISFVAFGIYDASTGIWQNTFGGGWGQVLRIYGIPTVPVLSGVDPRYGALTLEYSDAGIRSMIDGKTQLGGDHVREGIVIHAHDGRKLKAVSDAYLERVK